MKLIRIAILFGGFLNLALALGYSFQVPFVTALWPWPDGRLSYLFIGSILAAVSASMLWIGWSGELSALPGGTLNIFAIGASSSAYLTWLATQENRPALWPDATVTAAIALASLLAFLWSRRLPLRDTHPTPLPVRISFAVFLTALVLASLSLILRLPIFPWALNPDSSVLFGCIFLGNATYFLHGSLYPRWHNALGQLLSFLAYDLVLIGPFLLLFQTVQPQFMLSLVIYVVVLLCSGAVAFYYLFVNQGTRMWAR